MPTATLLEFARVNDAAAATTKKLQKYAILGAYFAALADNDLRLAVRFAAGQAFAATEERVLAVGGAIVGEMVRDLLRIDPRTYHDAVVRSGEIGEALAKLWKPLVFDPEAQTRRAASRIETLTLHDLRILFDDLASTGNMQRKHANCCGKRSSAAPDPREAAYLAKIIFGDLRTGVQEGVLHYAIAQAFSRDVARVQRAQLLVGDLGDVAVLAKDDQLESAQFALFHPVQFMLAAPQETAGDAIKTMEDRPFFAEDKLDGIRAQVHKQGDRVAIYTRTMDRTDESFPDVVAAIRNLSGDFLLDGEIVPWREGKVLPFAHIQKRLGRKTISPKIIRENPAALIAFDILYRDGELLMEQPLRQRRAALESLGPELLVTKMSEVTTTEEIERAFIAARDARNEGLVLKDPESIYSPGRRGKAWLKIKTHLPTFDCVVTFAETGHGKRRSSLSDYTFAVWDREPGEDGAMLVNVGKAYSGVTDAEIAQLTELFTTITIEDLGRVRRVEPKIVLEIACDQIQKSDRHASGYAFRFPRIKRIRWDKAIADADRLSRVIEVYESAENFGRSTQAEAPVLPEPTLFDGLA